MRVLVCGGREYVNQRQLSETMNTIHAERKIDVVIHGKARGADSMAHLWARAYGIPDEAYPAQWDLHGKAAGAIRNQQMLDEGKPDLVVAFPGGRGTADMVRRARKAGVEVTEVAVSDPVSGEVE